MPSAENAAYNRYRVTEFNNRGIAPKNVTPGWGNIQLQTFLPGIGSCPFPEPIYEKLDNNLTHAHTAAPNNPGNARNQLDQGRDNGSE